MISDYWPRAAQQALRRGDICAGTVSDGEDRRADFRKSPVDQALGFDLFVRSTDDIADFF